MSLAADLPEDTAPANCISKVLRLAVAEYDHVLSRVLWLDDDECAHVQREGQGGLEVCPGREASTDFGVGNDWTPVVPRNDAITINIGDLLMRWC